MVRENIFNFLKRKNNEDEIKNDNTHTSINCDEKFELEDFIEFLNKNNINKKILENAAFKNISENIVNKINKYNEGYPKEKIYQKHVGEILYDRIYAQIDSEQYYKINVLENGSINIVEYKNIKFSEGDNNSITVITNIKSDDNGITISEIYNSDYYSYENDKISKIDQNHMKKIKKYDEYGIEYEELQEKHDRNITEKLLKTRIYPDVMKVCIDSTYYGNMEVYSKIPCLNGSKELTGLNLGTDFSNINTLVSPIEKPSIEEYHTMEEIPGMDKYMRARYGVAKDRIDFSYSIEDNQSYGI